MANIIFMDTQVMHDLSIQITGLDRDLAEISGRISRSLTEVQRVASGQERLIGMVSQLQKNAMSASQWSHKLSTAVKSASDMWDEAERRLAGLTVPMAQAEASAAGGGEAAGSDFLKKLVLSPMWLPLLGVLYGPVQGGVLLIGGIGETIYNEGVGGLFKKIFTNTFEGSAAWKQGEHQDGSAYSKWDIFGGSFKSKGGATWDPNKGEAKITQSITGEGHLVHREDGRKWKYGSVSNEVTVGGGSVKGEVGLTLMKDGKFDPSIGAKAKAEAYVIRDKISGKVGTDDVNGYASAEGTLLGADAEAKAGFDNGKLSAKAGAEAYVAKGEIKGGIDIFGVKIGATGTAMYGVNATAGMEVATNAVEGEIGLGPFKIKLDVDWSGLTKRLFS